VLERCLAVYEQHVADIVAPPAALTQAHRQGMHPRSGTSAAVCARAEQTRVACTAVCPLDADAVCVTRAAVQGSLPRNPTPAALLPGCRQEAGRTTK
jgi:hypothetical protein